MKLAIILNSPPYGDINAAEAVRHAIGASGEEIETSLILFDDAVFLVKKDQASTEGGFMPLEEHIEMMIDMGVKVLVDRVSMSKRGLYQKDLIEGVEVIEGYEASLKLMDADKTMIF